MAKAPEFPGFSKELLSFLQKLARNNNKTWFDAHREEYDELYLEPAKAFATALAPALAMLGEDIQCEPRVNGAIMRINRDIRFSKDKTPYKTALHFRFPAGDPRQKQGSAFFLRVAADSVAIGAGCFGFEPKALARYRAAVVDQSQGKALRAAIDKVRKAGPYELPTPEYKRVPKGFDADHPNADLLLFKSFFAHAELGLPKQMFGKQAVPFVAGHFKSLRPVQDWLANTVDP